MTDYIPSLIESRDKIVSVLAEFGYIPDHSYPPHEGKFDRMYFRKEFDPYPRMVAFHNLSNLGLEHPYVGVSVGQLVGKMEAWTSINPYKMSEKNPENEEDLLRHIRNAMSIFETTWFPSMESKNKTK